MDVMISSLGFNTEALISAGINTQTFGVLGTGFFFVGLMIGRFLGSIILNWLSPKRFLMWTGLLAVFAILLLFLASTQTQVFIIMALIGIGFANIFPLIFSITVESMPERTNELSGLMITAILGGAVVPLLTGALTDAVSIFAGFMVPAVCMVFIITLSFNTRKQ